MLDICINTPVAIKLKLATVKHYTRQYLHTTGVQFRDIWLNKIARHTNQNYWLSLMQRNQNSRKKKMRIEFFFLRNCLTILRTVKGCYEFKPVHHRVCHFSVLRFLCFVFFLEVFGAHILLLSTILPWFTDLWKSLLAQATGFFHKLLDDNKLNR